MYCEMGVRWHINNAIALGKANKHYMFHKQYYEEYY